MRTQGREFMRILAPHSRLRVMLLAVTLLAVIPAAANAAPKNVKYRFGATAYSVGEANTTLNVTVLRTGNKNVSASVKFDVDPATTATGYSLNPAAGTTLSFAPGQTQKTIAVTISDDSVFSSPNKKIVLKLSNPSPGSVPAGQQKTTITILDNDGPGTIDLDTAAYNVVECAGFATVTVARNGNPMLIESVPYSTSDGTATAGSDYTSTSGTVTFGVGETSKSFQIPINDDQDFEGDENLTVTLGTPQNLSNPSQPPNLGPNTPATLTIADDDVPTFAFDAATYSVGENNGPATITVTRGGATYVAADVDYSTSDGTATIAGGDYTAASGTLHFAAGEVTKTFTVGITNDSASEGNETVDLHLSFDGSEVDTAQLSIVDNDNPLPSVQFSNPTYSVGENGVNATVTATLSHVVDGDVTVHYATADGTASAGADYTDTHGDLTFKGNTSNGGTGETSKTIDIPVADDTDVEDDETFTVQLSAPTGAVLGSPNPTTVTIVDNDDFGNFEFSKQRYDVNEKDGHVTVTVKRVGGSGGDVAVNYATSDGSATAPSDYAATSGTLHFANGDTSKTFDVPVNWDGRAEGDETISIDLSNPDGGADLGTTTAAVIHVADDGASGPVQFSAASYSVSETAGNATITVNRSGGSLGGPVTVDYAGTDGTHGKLTFGPGDATQSFQVPVVDDTVHTGTRTVGLSLSNPGGGTSLADPSTATLNITDDEPASSPSTDKSAPKLTITAKKLQKALKGKTVVFKVRSNEAASLKITLKFRKGKGAKRKVVVVKKASKKVAAGKTVKVTLKLNKKALRALTKALVKGKVKVTLSVKGTDAAKNSATVNKTITLK
jgi:hypothetical protein